MKMSRSESGRLGAIKSKIAHDFRKQGQINEYYKNPTTCLNCKKILPYEKRENKFCNRSCAGIYNNSKKDWSNIRTGPVPKKQNEIKKDAIYKEVTPNKVIWICLDCKTKHLSSKHRVGKFCNVICQRNYIYKEKISKWDIIPPGKGAIKRYLKETFGNVCSVCGINTWNNKEIVLELEHKDGNSENNHKDNLCLICPNCHSQTDTYKGKNKGNGRHLRKLRYREGKSY